MVRDITEKFKNKYKNDGQGLLQVLFICRDLESESLPDLSSMEGAEEYKGSYNIIKEYVVRDVRLDRKMEKAALYCDGCSMMIFIFL